MLAASAAREGNGMQQSRCSKTEDWTRTGRDGDVGRGGDAGFGSEPLWQTGQGAGGGGGQWMTGGGGADREKKYGT